MTIILRLVELSESSVRVGLLGVLSFVDHVHEELSGDFLLWLKNVDFSLLVCGGQQHSTNLCQVCAGQTGQGLRLVLSELDRAALGKIGGHWDVKDAVLRGQGRGS